MSTPAVHQIFLSRNTLRIGTLCVLLSLSASTAWSHDSFHLWHGIGIQGQQSQWSTEIDLWTAKPKVRYPSLKCSGEWHKLGTENGVDQYLEVITVGRETCIDGFVRVHRLSNKRMTIEYFENKGGPMIAKAVLFPGKHHEGKQRHMVEVTRAYIAAGVKK